MNWIEASTTPDIPKGTEREFIVACRRANGKTYVFAACWLNARLLFTDSDDCPEDGEPFTGWYQERAYDGDYDTAWLLVCNDGDVITHWMPLPESPC